MEETMSGPYREAAPKQELYFVDFTVKMVSGEEHKFSFEGVAKGNVGSLIEIQLGKFVSLSSSFRFRTSQTYRTQGQYTSDLVLVDKNFNGMLLKQGQIESVKYVVVNEDEEREYCEKTNTCRPLRKIINDGLR
jgi:hypothetical protein